MNIDRFLGSKGIPALQSILLRWKPRSRRSNSKASLQRSLRSAMLDVKRIEQHLDGLHSPETVLLRAILLSPDTSVTWDWQLSRRLGVDQRRLDAARDRLTEVGFIGTTASNVWEGGGQTLFVPDELALRLRNLLDIDLRPPLQVVSLRGFVEALEPDRRRELLEPFGLAPIADDLDRVTSELLCPDAVLARIERQDAEFRTIFEEVLHEYQGIAASAAVFHDRRREAREWRNLAETALLGTVCELPLYIFGIDDAGPHLVLFREVCDALSAPLAVDVTAGLEIAAAGADFLVDICMLCDEASDHPLRVTQSGKLFKSVVRRLLRAFVQSETLGRDQRDLLLLKVMIAKDLNLLRLNERNGLAATRHYATWEKLPIEDRVAELHRSLLKTRDPQSANSPVIRMLLAELAGMHPGRWYDALVPVRRTFSNLMLDAKTWQQQLTPEDMPLPKHDYVHHHNFTDVCRALFRSVVPDLQALGLVDVAVEPEAPACIRLTPLGDCVLNNNRPQRSADDAPGIRLVVNPDFEVLAMPDGDIHLTPASAACYHLQYSLSRFCERAKSTHQVQHYRISRRSVERAVVRGMTADEMIDTIRCHSTVPVPQNVEYSLRSWIEGVRLATAQTVCLLEVPDEHAMQVVLGLPVFSPLVIRVISPTAAILKSIPRERTILEALRKIGVHLTFPMEDVAGTQDDDDDEYWAG